MAGIINNAQQVSTTPPPDYTGQLTGLYQKNFGRAPDAAGMDFFGKNMANGTTVDQVDQAMQGSDEYKALHAPNAPPSSPVSAAPPPGPSAPTPSPGIINSYMPQVTPATATPATSTGYTATHQGPAVSSDITRRVVDPATQTVAGQVAGIINQNSPLMQQAQATALQRANDRGLGNSSIAVGAAQDAVLSAATPIGTADANVYGNAENLNTTTENQFKATKDAANNTINANNAQADTAASQFGATAKNTESDLNAQLGTNVSLANSGALNQASTVGAQLTSQHDIAQLQSNTQQIINDKSIASADKNAALNAQTNQAIASANAGNALTIAQNNTAAQVQIAGLNTENARAISDAQLKNQLVLSSNSEAGANARTAMSTLITGLANIQMQPGMSADAKATALANLYDAYNATVPDPKNRIALVGTAADTANKAAEATVNVQNQLADLHVG